MFTKINSKKLMWDKKKNKVKDAIVKYHIDFLFINPYPHICNYSTTILWLW